MFNQEKCGKFIAACRKEKGMTQRQLADELMISDKTVSKWETGNGMPDTSIMEQLCEILDINVNELLSGERLSEDGYSKKAEENMMTLMKEKETDKGVRFWTILLTLVGAACCLVVLTSTRNFQVLMDILDLPSVLLVCGLVLLSLGLSGYMHPFMRGFSLLSGKRLPTDETATREYRAAADAFSFAARVSLLSGVAGSILGLVMALRRLDDVSTLGPFVAIACLTLFYGALFAILFLILKGRLKNKLS